MPKFVSAADSPFLRPQRSAATFSDALSLAQAVKSHIWISISGHIAIEAAKSGLLNDITLTAESGAMKGIPTSGTAFGAAVGTHSICSIAQQFDFYNGGG